MKVRDLVELPVIKTVVHLRDAQQEAERERLVDNFILTDEVRTGLRVILQQVIRNEGGGYFLKGHYGSGKSHFLAYLGLILSLPEFLDTFLDRYRKLHSSQAMALQGLKSRRIAVVSLSLVDHRSTSYLEDILSAALRERLAGLPSESPSPDGEVSWEELLRPHREALRAYLDERGLRYQEFIEDPESLSEFANQAGLRLPRRHSRKDFLEAVFEALKKEGCDGLLLLVDELSEFLRSKPSLRHFNEDIRYLQFLGEASKRHGLWVVAALQEYLEETGEINQELFNKIKDRYPARIQLNAHHVKTLVSELLVRKKAAADEVLGKLYGKFKTSFPHFAVSRQEFCRLYPVHPASIDLLDDLKPLFSKTRGFIDFIHHQIQGDRSRSIRGLMDLPVDTLLCPDRIFDHFLDRMKETIELLPFIETVYGFFEREVGSILENAEDQRYGLRLIRLLILQDISPAKRAFSVRQLSEMLLERITDLDPEVNYQYTADIANQLYEKGGYLEVSDEAGDLQERSYRIRFEANIRSIVERKLEYKKQVLKSQGRRIAERVFPRLAARMAYFEDLLPASRQLMAADWQKTRRTGSLEVAPANEGAPSPQEAPPKGSPKAQEFRLIVLLPGQQAQTALKLIEPDEETVGIYVPAPLQDPQSGLQALALLELLDEYQQDASAQGERIRRQLERLIEEAVQPLASIFQSCYQRGQFLSPQGEVLHHFEGGAAPRLRELLEDAVEHLLEWRYPKHYLIAPQQEYYPQAALNELGDFFRDMSAESFEKLRWGRTVLDGFLLPTGILKRSRKEYRFAVTTSECAPLQLLLDWLAAESLAGREGLSASEAAGRLARSEYGMSELQFKPFLMAAVFAGFLVARRQGRRLPVSRLGARQLYEIDQLEAGETVSQRTLNLLTQLEFLPKRLRRSSLSFAECSQAWELLRRQRHEMEHRLQDLERMLQRFSEYRAFQGLDREKAGQLMEDSRQLARSVKLSLTPIEGLETFSEAALDAQKANHLISGLEAMHHFFSEHFAGFSFVAGYLEGASQAIPGSEAYEAVKEPLEKIASQMRDWDAAGKAGRFEALKEDFDAWRHQYASTYQEEHQRFYSQEAGSQVEQVLQGDAFQTLQKLDRLRPLGGEGAAARIEESMGRLQPSPCHRSVFEELQQRPQCSCGFRLGQLRKEIRTKKIEAEIRQRLDQMAAQVSHPRFQEFLDRYEFQRRQSESKAEKESASDSSLQGVAQLRQAGNTAQLVECAKELGSGFIERLNAFEPDREPFARKSLSDFLYQMGSTPHPRSEWLKRFGQWLEEGLSDSAQPIRLSLRPDKPQQDEDLELEGLIRNCEKALLEDFQRLTRREFFIRLHSAALLTRHQLPAPESPASLPLLPSDTTLDAYARLALVPEVAAARAAQEARQSLEEMLGESGYSDLELLQDSALKLAGVVCRETVLPGLVRWATLRLLKKLAHAARRSFTQVHKLLAEKWSLPASGNELPQRLQARTLLESFLAVYRSDETLLDLIEESPSLARLERCFSEDACRIPYHSDRCRVHLEQLDGRSHLDFDSKSKSLGEALQRFNNLFAQSAGQEDEKLSRVEQVLEEAVPGWIEESGAQSSRLLFVDCLAWPLWTLLSERLQQRMPARVRLIEARVAHAYQPSNTLEQVTRWIAAGGPMAQDRLQKGFSFPSGDEEGVAYKLDWVDEKIHTSRESPYFLYEEILEQLSSQLGAILNELPAGTLLVVFSDHGFIESPHFDPGDKYKRPRYGHGGNSPFETVVPVAAFYAGSGGV